MPSSSVDTSEPRPLSGQLVVITGKLSSLGRKEAHQLVLRLGGRTADGARQRDLERGTQIVAPACRIVAQDEPQFGSTGGVVDEGAKHAIGESVQQACFTRHVREVVQAAIIMTE